MKRSQPLRSDPDATRAFIQRGRGKLKRLAKCERCGEPLTGRAKRFCSRPCLLATIADDRRLPAVNCAQCGLEFRPRVHHQRFCSHSCAASHHNAARRRQPSRCSVCGAAIDPGCPSKPRRTCGAQECVREAKARSKRGKANPNWKDVTAPQRWSSAKAKRCVCCSGRDRLQLHHVVYRQHVKAAKGDCWDPDDSLTLCLACHTGHHHAGTSRLPLAKLRDENYSYAEALLGAGAAYEYLKRRYAGGDQRLDELLGRAA